MCELETLIRGLSLPKLLRGYVVRRGGVLRNTLTPSDGYGDLICRHKGIFGYRLHKDAAITAGFNAPLWVQLLRMLAREPLRKVTEDVKLVEAYAHYYKLGRRETHDHILGGESTIKWELRTENLFCFC